MPSRAKLSGYLFCIGTMAERREIVFRARRKDNGDWVEGNYHHNVRKGTSHTVSPKETNEPHEVYRESLQMRTSDPQNLWEDI